MSESLIREEILWQIKGREENASLDPRRYAYRILTVLGVELNLDIIDTTEQAVIQLVGMPATYDEFDDGDGGWDYGDENDYDHNDDRYSYAESAPLIIEMPFSKEYEDVFLTQYPDTDIL